MKCSSRRIGIGIWKGIFIIFFLATIVYRLYIYFYSNQQARLVTFNFEFWFRTFNLEINYSTYCSANCVFNPLSANLTKWSNTLKQFVGKLPTNCLSVFDHFVRLTLKELTYIFADNKCLVSYATLKAPIVCCTKKELPEFWWENRHPRLCKWKSLDGLPEDSWALFSWKKQLFPTFLKTVRTYKSTSSFSKVTIKSAVMESATLSMKFCTIGKESERISWRAHSSRRSYGDQKKTGQRRICWFYSFK